MRGERIQDDENGDGDGGGDGGGDGDGDGDGHIWGSESKFGAQICIKVAFDIRFSGPGGIWCTGDQESPKSSEEAPKRLPRSPQDAPKRLLRGAVGALEVQKAPKATILDTFIG